MLNLVREAAGVTEYLLPPLPNTLYTRDTTCWIYGGCTVNPLYWPARHEETILTTSIYKFHPDFAGKVKVWWGDPTEDHGLATLEGGDVMPIGKGNVLIGMSERTSRQAISQLAASLFKQRAADRVIVAAMPKLRAAMHLDTIFTFADRDCVLIYPDIVNNIHAYSYRPANNPSGIELRKDEKPFVETVGTLWASRRCVSLRQAERPTCGSARNGTAAPISFVLRQALSLLMIAIPTPTLCYASRALKSSRSRAPSWVADGAADIA